MSPAASSLEAQLHFSMPYTALVVACLLRLDDDYHYYDSLTPVAIGVWCSFVSDQFTSLHKKETVDPCGVAGIFGCNAGATTHAARSGPGYVNINGYKVSLVDVDIKLLG